MRRVAALIGASGIFVVLSSCSVQVAGVEIRFGEARENLLVSIREALLELDLQCLELDLQRQFGSCHGEAGSDGIQSAVFGIDERGAFISLPYESSFVVALESPSYRDEFIGELDSLLASVIDLGATAISFSSFPATSSSPKRTTVLIEDFEVEMLRN